MAGGAARGEAWIELVYLLDTNVVSELRRPRPHGAVLAWLASVPDDRLFVSAVTLGELQAGVELTRDQDPGKASEIEAWVDSLATTQNILAPDGRCFRVWAKLLHNRSDELIEDALIAATAIVHGLTVATRNVRHFEQLGVTTFNPFSSGAAGS